MKLNYLVVSALFVLPACGPQVGAQGGEGSGTDSSAESEGTDTDPTNSESSAPTECLFDNEVYEDGVEFETADGCVRYTCNAGFVETLESQLVTIPGDLTFETQEDVNSQICLSIVEGTLTITGTAADLTPLTQLIRVDGDLVVTASEAVSLVGLETLAEVGQSVTIIDNPNLTTMAFQPFMSVFGDATIQNNDALVSLAGAEFIGQCGACSVVEPEIRGLAHEPEPFGASGPGGGEAPPEGTSGSDTAGADEPQGGTFYGSILIADNELLSDVTALSALYAAWADVRFRNNPSVENLIGLNLGEVQGDFEISGHALLPETDAQAVTNSVNVWGITTVCGNMDGMACPE
ncbi:MAG: hypothetical protein KUG77_29525 [Nannocystaceae bacterium]|nr:hypothetical protein [Nannocystaceae bacterium]